MNERELADKVRDLLGERDRARRGQLFRPDRAIEADAVFVAAVRELAEERAQVVGRAHREEIARLRGELTQARAANVKLSDDYAKALAMLPPEHAPVEARKLSDGPGAPQDPPATQPPRRTTQRRSAASTGTHRAKPGSARKSPEKPGAAT